MVETEQSAEAHAPLHVGVRAPRWWGSSQEPVAQPLMIPLTVVVRDIFADKVALPYGVAIGWTKLRVPELSLRDGSRVPRTQLDLVGEAPAP